MKALLVLGGAFFSIYNTAYVCSLIYLQWFLIRFHSLPMIDWKDVAVFSLVVGLFGVRSVKKETEEKNKKMDVAELIGSILGVVAAPWLAFLIFYIFKLIVL